MRARRLRVAGGWEFTPTVHQDARGVFASPLQDEAFVAAVGHRFPVAQTNHIVSERGVLRGVHFTASPGQSKYVHCAAGRALDIMIDVRTDSPTFGSWEAVELDPVACNALYFPIGTAHAFMALEPGTIMSYLVSTPYEAELELAIDPFDTDLALPWPTDVPVVLSARDEAAMSFAQAHARGLLPGSGPGTVAEGSEP
ncbi:MAG: dTDP-4-dehydrorhamnose 3,5-epimerase family protein [Propionibacteriales bacterium]|nr:dTDP-4-dehydrorhamnose 3,5-epimerase family protein [Propionibacteriales bacterium]